MVLMSVSDRKIVEMLNKLKVEIRKRTIPNNNESEENRRSVINYKQLWRVL